MRSRGTRTRDVLIQAAKLPALGQMSAGINHELNQPLAAMRTYADNARTFLDRGNLEKAGWNLEQIGELTRCMAQISGQLKVFSRRSSGQPIRVSVRACVVGAERIVSTRLKQCGAELTIELPVHDLIVAADMVQLEQLLVNLVGNACGAMAGQSDKRIVLRAWRDGDVVRLQVQHSGPGIDADKLARIFRPFLHDQRGRAWARSVHCAHDRSTSRWVAQGRECGSGWCGVHNWNGMRGTRRRRSRAAARSN